MSCMGALCRIGRSTWEITVVVFWLLALLLQVWAVPIGVLCYPVFGAVLLGVTWVAELTAKSFA